MDMADAGKPDTQRVQLPVTRGPIRMFTIGNIPVTATIELELPVSKSSDLCANHGCGKHGTKLCGGCGEVSMIDIHYLLFPLRSLSALGSLPHMWYDLHVTSHFPLSAAPTIFGKLGSSFNLSFSPWSFSIRLL